MCLQRGVANAVITHISRLTVRTLNPGSYSAQGESSFPSLVEEQSEAYRDGSPIAWQRKRGQEDRNQRTGSRD